MENDIGVRIENHEGMCRIIQDYYQTIFKASAEVRVEESTIHAIVSREQNTQLVRELSYEEFTTAVHQMHQDKESGPDGLNPSFYQHFWDSLGIDVFECCKSSLASCSFPVDFNHKSGFNSKEDMC